MYSIGGCFIPALAIGLTGRHIDLYRLLKFLYYLALLSSSLFISYVYLNALDLYSIFEYRFYIKNEDGAAVFNPIMISQMGALNIITGVVYYAGLRRKNVMHYCLLMTSFIMGIGLLIIGSSRGAMMSLLLIFVLCFVYVIKKRRYFIYVLLLPVIVGIVIYLVSFIPNDFSVVNRVGRGVELSGRALLWKQSLLQFSTNPVIGDKFFVNSGAYSHNVVIEVLMSTGLIGFMPFAYCIYLSIVKVLKSLNRLNVVLTISLLYLMFLIFVQTSSAIYSMPRFWVMLTLLLGYRDMNKVGMI